MHIKKIEHIGIAVADLSAALKYYEQTLGLSCYAIEEVPDQKVRTAFLQIGEVKIELLESTDPDGPVGKFIEKRGEGVHHIAFTVEAVEQALEELAQNEVRLIDTHPRKGAEGLDIAFIHPKSSFGVLTEICSHPSE